MMNALVLVIFCWGIWTICSNTWRLFWLWISTPLRDESAARIEETFWILDENYQPKRVHSYDVWRKWRSRSNPLVNYTVLNDITISTVFLGVDHNNGQSLFPLLFETMIMPGNHHGVHHAYRHGRRLQFANQIWQKHTTTLDQALTAHWEACDLVTEAVRTATALQQTLR